MKISNHFLFKKKKKNDAKEMYRSLIRYFLKQKNTAGAWRWFDRMCVEGIEVNCSILHRMLFACALVSIFYVASLKSLSVSRTQFLTHDGFSSSLFFIFIFSLHIGNFCLWN